MTISINKIIRNYLSGSDERSINVVINAMVSGVMKVASLLCSLIIVPITIHYLSSEKYGIWMAMTSILYWFAFFDVGLGNGMRNYLAEALSIGDYEKARSYFSTAMFLLAGIAVLIGCIIIPFVFIFDLNFLFNAYNVDGNFLAKVLTVAIAFSLIQFVVKNIGMVYVAMQKYAVNDLIVFLGNISSLAVIYILTETTEQNLMYVVCAFTGIPVLIYLLSFIPLIKKYPQLTPSVKKVDLYAGKKLVLKGLGFFVIQITSCLIIFGSANIFISHYCGPEQVTVYNVSYKLFNVLIIGYTILISPLWSAYTDAAAKGDYIWIKKIFKKSLMFWGLSVICGFIMLVLSGFFFEAWIGNSVKIPFIVSVSVLLYVCMFNFNNCVTYLINGINKIHIQIISSVVVTVLYLLSILLLNDELGVVGISLLMFIAYLLMSSVHLYQCYLLINQKARGIWNK